MVSELRAKMLMLKKMIKMKKLLVISLLILGLAISPGLAVIAEGDDSTSSTDGQSTKIEDRSSKIKDRQEDRRERIKDRLTDARAKRIKNRCTAAQRLIKIQLTRVEKVVDNRTNVYEKISEKLSAIVVRLFAAGVDTSQLESDIAKLDALIVDFNSNLEVYQQALIDASEIDCQADVEAFHLALVDARQQKRSLLADAKVIKDFVQSDIRATINDLKDRLKSDDVVDQDSQPATSNETDEQTSSDEGDN